MSNIEEQLKDDLVRYFFKYVRTYNSGYASAFDQFNAWVRLMSRA